jgi:hypothetical protein
VISECGRYRYRLERSRNEGSGDTVFIMVNPSTADHENNDHTIRKLLGFASRNGWDNLVVGNLFAFRATDVRELATAADPIGPENDEHLKAMISGALRLIFAWGPTSKLPKRLRTRWRTIYGMARDVGVIPHSLGPPAKDGHPCHPLMLPYTRRLEPWRPAL